MELEDLKKLPAADRWIFVRGRVATEAVELDAALRGVHAALRGRGDREALLGAPESWSAARRECLEALADFELDTTMRVAIKEALSRAEDVWRERHRYVHDLLVESLDTIDEMPEVIRPAGAAADDDRYQLRLAHRAGAPDGVQVSFDGAIDLVVRLLEATWRLRAARLCISEGSATWRQMLFSDLDGNWDGTVSWG
jgi:hypothetical protein